MNEVDIINIENRIFTFRGLQVMLDSDLARMYQVDTRVFNQAVKRNIDRFPDIFRFQLTEDEYANLRSQIVISSDNSLKSQSVTFKKKTWWKKISILCFY